MKKIFSLFAAVLMAGSMMAADYVKVTTAPTSWEGEYLIVNETASCAFNATDAASAFNAVTITDGTITNDTVESFVVAVLEGGGYSVAVKGGVNDGKYLSSGSSAPAYTNAIKFNATAHRVDFAMDGANVVMSQTTTSGDVTMRYNKASDQKRFRFYKSGQEPVQLYKKVVAPVANDTVFFVNAADWAAVKVHAWDGTAAGTTWPGLDATKADYQLQGKDVYYFVAAPGAYGKCIFNNNNGAQTANLDWTPGKYYYNGSWMTRAELEAPVVVDMYIKHNWAENPWTWKQMTYDAETETYLLREIYGATGCNWNTSASDAGATWVANPTVVGNPVAGDSAVFALKNGEITITKIGEPSPEPTSRFLKHNWGGAGDWTWKEMTREGETSTYTLRDIYGGTGCNWNVVGNDAGATWVASPTLEGEPAVGDSAVFSLVEGVITITKIESEGPGPGPEPEIIDTLYLVNSKGWGAPKIHLWDGTATGTTWPGVAMVKVNGVQADGFDVYMYSYNHGDYAKCIFNNGNGVQSGNLTIAGNEGKYFNFADQTWYESAEAVVCTWYLNANYNGTTEWRELTPAADRKSFTRRDVYAPATNYYYNGMAADNLRSEIKGAKLTVDSELAAGDSATFTLDPYAKTINIEKIAYHTPVITKDTAMFVAGNFTNWAEGMQELPYTVALPADSALEFKQVMQVITYADAVATDTALTWYGQVSVDGHMTRESFSWLLNGEYNVLLNTDAAGEYTFSLNESGEFTVTFPDKTATGINNIEAGKAVKVVENGQVVIIKNGVRYNAVGAKL